MDSLTRRTFLEKVSVLTAGAFVAASGLLAAVAEARSEPHIAFPTSPRDRLAVASYPFRAYIESPGNRDRDRSLPGMDLTEFAAEVVKKFNVHNIEPHSRHFRSLDAEYLGRFREALQKANAKAVDIAVDGRDSFYDENLSIRKKAVAFGKTWVDVAAAIGCPSIRTHIAGKSSPNVPRTVESLREVASYGAEKNIVVNLENDDLVSEDAFFLVKVIETVDSPYLHALPDFANSMLTGDADFNYRAVQAMFQHAYCICHVKDGETGDGGKEFNIDMAETFGILKASGYRGYCSMEYDRQSGDPYAATAKLIEQSLQYLS
jgi:sugar phosphate isomerase/epimerase